jgi:Tol biopolymer transport system component
MLLPLLLAALAAQQPPSHGEFPAISPDGRVIAFWADRDSTPSPYVIGVDGTGERRLTTARTGPPQWSPDGRELRVAGGGADSGTVFVLSPDGGPLRPVAHVPGRGPRLSPDGARVAFLQGPWTATVLAVADTGGASPRAIAGGSGTTAWNAAWSPDGRRIAYTHGDSTHVLQVHVVNVDGTDDHAVTHMSADEGSAQLPAWSPDGRRLAFQVSRRARPGHIWVVDLASGVARKLAPHDSTYQDEVPAWFPDGKRIAFQSDRTGRMEVWIMKDDGTGQRQVTGVAAAP